MKRALLSAIALMLLLSACNGQRMGAGAPAAAKTGNLKDGRLTTAR